MKEELERRRRRLDLEIETLEEQVRTDDEDEREDARRALDQAYSSRANLRDQGRRLASAAARHDKVAASWLQGLETAVPSAAAFLAQKHADALSYLQVGEPVGDSSHSMSHGRSAATEAEIADKPVGQNSVPADPTCATSPEDLPVLPDGFSWIPIAQIDQSDLPRPDDFPKVSYDTMHAGLQRLWTELVPLLRTVPGADRKSFQEFDEAHGRIDPMGFVHEESLAHLWDQFFEERFRNHIRVTADNHTGGWSVDNGRHRIRVAQDIGWKYVPGQLKHIEPLPNS